MYPSLLFYEGFLELSWKAIKHNPGQNQLKSAVIMVGFYGFLFVFLVFSLL